MSGERIIRVPRWERDILSKQRTLAHLPVNASNPESGPSVGETFMLLPAAGSVGVTALFTRSEHRVVYVRVVRCDVVVCDQWTATDIRKLNLRGDGTPQERWHEYRQRCIALWGDGVAWVFRIEFEYLGHVPPSPEECLAA